MGRDSWGETGSVRAPRARLWLSDAREQPTPSWAAGGLDLRLCNRCRALAYHTRAPCLSLPVGTGIRERATGDRDGTRSDKSAKRALSFWNTSERGERAPKTFLLCACLLACVAGGWKRGGAPFCGHERIADSSPPL